MIANHVVRLRTIQRMEFTYLPYNNPAVASVADPIVMDIKLEDTKDTRYQRVKAKFKYCNVEVLKQS